jgi:hypothetical protein
MRRRDVPAGRRRRQKLRHRQGPSGARPCARRAGHCAAGQRAEQIAGATTAATGCRGGAAAAARRPARAMTEESGWAGSPGDVTADNGIARRGVASPIRPPTGQEHRTGCSASADHGQPAANKPPRFGDMCGIAIDARYVTSRPVVSREVRCPVIEALGREVRGPARDGRGRGSDGGRWLDRRAGGETRCDGRAQHSLDVGDERRHGLAGVQGGAEEARVPVADGGGPGGLGQDPDGRVQGDQVEEVPYVGGAWMRRRARTWRAPGTTRSRSAPS